MKIEKKTFGGNIVEYKQEQRNGVPVGIVAGYMATWDLDRGDDKFLKGAFLDSIAEHREKDRPIRLKKGHDETIGGFPIDSVREDDRGLYGVGEINLDTQEGREAFSLAKQGVLSDFSIGFSVVDFEIHDGVRIIKNAVIWETSVVDEPMNPEANITEVKSVVPFQDLPITEQDREWDGEGAIKRIRGLTGSKDKPSESYKNAFVWYDKENEDEFGSYKFPIADVINGKMVVFPRAVFDAATAVQGARGGIDIPEQDMPAVIRHLERYYSKIGADSPFEEKRFFSADDVKGWGKREVEESLVKSGAFSKKAAKTIASMINQKFDKKENLDQTEGDERVLNNSSLSVIAEKLLAELGDLKSKI